ncbi:putative ATP-dependent helicase [Aeropyrum pernix K1]|uniref:ATP-dependent helicase n=1 Tax=Aeropyrum pernix (strain ATCC 700893 / DSM 11879 / JCM 9820 / NBRC 100138 / K1) TaxID=272557 RepID=Q9Y9V1_AERPE|nr:DEAD/DEAH box helicase [Aeropyrum pernix]BAA81199.2 putative ATP-dependent helicase [Aeropyrum pernix K1]
MEESAVPGWVLELLREAGYKSLLPIQEKAFPIIYRGLNALVVAPTGSGKTEAALAPLLARLRNGRVASGGGVKVVYVTPLRALNRDLEGRVERLAGLFGYTVQVRHGDTVQSSRRRFLERPPDIVITTPESLALLLTVKRAKEVLKQARAVVVDEIHELMESKRGVELSLNLEKLELMAGRRLQRIGLSATVSRHSLYRAASLLGAGRHVSMVLDTSPKEYDVRVVVVGDEGRFWENSVKAIAELVKGEGGSVLIFANTRSTVETLAFALSRELGEEVPAHHGSLSRHVRERVERDFKEGRVKAIVATSSLELGIDVGRVALVVQFLSPRQVTAMVQRAGRSGHRFGERSRAVIVTIDNVFEVLESHVIAFRAMKGDLEDISIPKKPYDALAHFMAGAAIDSEPPTLEGVYKLAVSTAPYEDLKMEEVEEIARVLSDVRVIRLGPGGKLGRSSRTYSYFYRVSMIPDEKTFKVHDVVSGRDVGEVGERFIQLRLMKASDPRSKPYIVLGGKVWKILEVDIDAGKVLVSPEGEVEGAIPAWEGELIPVDFKVAREVCSIMSLAMNDMEAGARLLRARRLDEKAMERVLDVLGETGRLWGTVLSWRRPVVEEAEGLAILYACLGSRGNFALSLLLSKLMEGSVAVEFHYIPYAIVFKSPASRGLGRLVAHSLKTLAKLEPAERLGMLYDAVRRSRAYLVRFYQVAKRMGVVDPDATLSLDIIRKMADAMQGTPVDIETVKELVHEKLDIDALNRFLDDVSDVAVVELQRLSPLARETLTNPYLRVDAAVSLKTLGLDKIIEAKKRRLSEKRIVFLCISCDKRHEKKVAELPRGTAYRCPYCGSLALAPLPPTETGERLAEAYTRKRKGAKLSREEAKLAREVEERARLYISLAVEGKARYIAEALSAQGVGPRRARSLLRELQLYGENRFYLALIKAEEDYVSNRRYWKS